MNKSNKAVSVLIAGTFINLAIGFLYTWSVFKNAMVLPIADGGWAWTNSQANLPYGTSTVVWAIALIIGGMMQDRIGPKKVIQIGLAFVSAGLIASGFANTPLLLTVAFGGIAASGVGLVYGCITPMCMKWFHSSKKGMVSGITVAGFGIAAVFIAPLATFLLAKVGISYTFLTLGVLVLCTAIPASLIVGNPPADYVAAAPANYTEESSAAAAQSVNMDWKQMMRTPSFYMVWTMFALSSSAGLMMIGHLASIASLQANILHAAFLVSILSISNAGGRVIAGILSDKIGRINTMLFVFSTQLINMALFNFYSTEVLITIGTIVAGFSYGSLLSTFPSITADKWGLKNYGGNYGVMFTAWGISGVVGPMIASWVADTTGNYAQAYTISAALLGVAIAIGITLKFVKTSAPTQDSTPDAEPEMA